MSKPSKQNFLIILLILLILPLFHGCSNNPGSDGSKDKQPGCETIKLMTWLAGTWINPDSSGFFTEKWKIEKESVFKAESYYIKGLDTLFAEHVVLECENGNLFYRVLTIGQSKRDIISFKLVKVSENEYVFENKAHDFPQQIIYKQINQDSLYAKIEGYENGTFRREEFPMKRMK